MVQQKSRECTMADQACPGKVLYLLDTEYSEKGKTSFEVEITSNAKENT